MSTLLQLIDSNAHTACRLLPCHSREGYEKLQQTGQQRPKLKDIVAGWLYVETYRGMYHKTGHAHDSLLYEVSPDRNNECNERELG